MIAKLTGKVDSFGEGHLILDVNGVGYLVFASARTLGRLGAPGTQVSLRIETQIREDAFNLFGFADKAEQAWFRLLTSVQGVGAKVALAILGAAPPDQLGFAIASGDKALLTRAEGVGPKLALRLVTELKDKAAQVDSFQPAAASVAAEGAGPVNGRAGDMPAGGMEGDALAALVSLGYGRTDAYAALALVRQKAGDSPPADVQALIRLSLKELAS